MNKAKAFEELMNERINKKLSSVVTHKNTFVYGEYSIENVPYNLHKDIKEPTDEDLSLSGLTMMRLLKIFKYMEENNLHTFNYESNAID